MQSEPLESLVADCRRGFGRIAAAPSVSDDPPADLDLVRGNALGARPDVIQPGEAEPLAGRFVERRSPPEAMRLPVLDSSIEDHVGFLFVQCLAGPDETHHLDIAADRSPVTPIPLVPGHEK